MAEPGAGAWLADQVCGAVAEPAWGRGNVVWAVPAVQQSWLASISVTYWPAELG